MEQRDFFISYTNSDEPWARWIADVLKSNGYTVYVQALDIKPGDNFLEKMNEFLKHSRNFIAVWSERYPKSRWCMEELQSAFYAWNKKTMNCLLPVRIDNHPLESLYAGLVYVYLSDKSAASETELMNVVRDRVPRLVAPQDAETLFQQGEDYYYGRNGIARDYAKALEYYDHAALKGSTDAWYKLSELHHKEHLAEEFLYERANDYFYGQHGLAQDYAKARFYYEEAAEEGSTDALLSLAIIYENGYGVEKNAEKALEYWGYAGVDIEKLREKMRRESE